MNAMLLGAAERLLSGVGAPGAPGATGVRDPFLKRGESALSWLSSPLPQAISHALEEESQRTISGATSFSSPPPKAIITHDPAQAKQPSC
jgi:hypothetical protein